MNINNTVNYTKKPVSGSRSGSYYIDVVQESYNSNSASLDETADFIDSIFDSEVCSDTEVTTKEELQAQQQAVLEKARSFLMSGGTRSPCSINSNMDFECWVRIYLSDWLEDYTLKLTNGEEVEGSKTHQLETIKEQYTVNEASSVKLQIPSSRLIDDSEEDEVDDAKFYWIICIPLDGQNIPNIYCNGQELYWNGQCTGTIDASYPAEYDRVKIKVPGINTTDFGECKAIGFYHSLIDEEDLEAPDTDTISEIERSKYCYSVSGEELEVVNKPVRCFETRRTRYLCDCSNGTYDELEEDVDVSCPDNISCGATPDCVYFMGTRETYQYVDCGETGEVNKKSFYEDHCCYPPDVSLPRCAEVYRKNPGGQSLDEETKQYYINKYGVDNVSFIGLMPEDGECGNTITRQAIPSANCCDEVDTIYFDASATPSVLPSDESIVVYADGGRAPYAWKTSNKSTYFLGGKQTIETDLPYTRLYSKSTFCGHTTVTIDDGCSSPQIEIRSDIGEWVEVPNHTCEFPGLGSATYAPPYALEFASFHTWSATITVGKRRQYEYIQGEQINDPYEACCGNYETGVVDCDCILNTKVPIDSNFCLNWTINFGDWLNCVVSTYGIRKTTYYCAPDYDSVFRHMVYQMKSADTVAYNWEC